MKLLMITGLGSARDLVSGKKGAFYNTLEEFSKYWERIDIIAPKTETRDKRQETSLFGNIFIHVSPWPLVFHPFWFLKKGLEIYKEQKFDLMTVQDYPPFYNGIGARLLWQKVKVPYILEFHHIPGYPKSANLKEKICANRLIWKFYWNLFGSKSKAIRVVNQKQTAEFLVKAGILKEKIVFIPSMYIDFDIFKPTNSDKEYDLIFVGRLADNKGINLFINAVKLLAINYKLPVRALIVGDGPLRGWVQSQITNYQLPITNFGWAKDPKMIAELMNKSKILIMSSYNEGGPRVVLEAMACGIPVLTTNVGLMSDFADKSSIKMIDWNAEDIASKAKELLENESERNRLILAGLETARQFEKTEMIKNYVEWLRGLKD